MKKITAFKVWKNSRPYLTIKENKMDEEIAKKLGFTIFEKRGFETQYYKTAPKTEASIVRLKKRLKRHKYLLRIKDKPRVTEKLGWMNFDGYEFGFKRNTQAEKIGSILIKKEDAHSSIVGCSVGHFFKSTPAPFDEETKTMTFAFATTANTMGEKFANLDFIIFYYEDAWETMNNEEREMLVDHELYHCAMDGTPYMRDHDVQEHSYIVSKYDLKPPKYHWATRALKKILQAREDEE